jgi:hypothetical protein
LQGSELGTLLLEMFPGGDDAASTPAIMDNVVVEALARRVSLEDDERPRFRTNHESLRGRSVGIVLPEAVVGETHHSERYLEGFQG